VSCKETTGTTEDRFGDQHLTAGYHDHLNRGTQILGESLQEFATAIEQMTSCAFLSYNYHIHRGPGKAFINGITDQGIKQQLLLGGSKTLNNAQGLGVIKLTVRSYIGLWKASDRHCGVACPLPSKRREY
jgi:hypothetical protein